MRLEQALSQRLALSQSMRQSLDCLQLPAPELSEYLQEAALSNPLLEVQPPTWYETALPSEAPSPEHEALVLRGDEGYSSRRGAEDAPDFTAYFTQEVTLRDHLYEQIGQMKLVDDELLRLCRFLIDCLDERGYLDCPLDELAQELSLPLFTLEQALFAVQMLDPPGVGARSLSECLTLQLAQRRTLDPLALAIARDGLELLAARDYAALAARLGADVSAVKRAAGLILALEPLPARSFSSGRPVAYTAPEAVFTLAQGRLSVELNEQVLPRLSINADYEALLTADPDPAVRRYVKEKLAEANSLLHGVHTRCDTLLRVLTLIAEEQRDYFSGGVLRPVTMQQAAEMLGLSVSTVSRAVQGKSIQFQGKVLPLRSFFTAAIRPDGAVSPQAAKQRLQSLILAEDPSAPLSDEALRLALSALGIELSRRAVAKYRAALGIPSSAQRKRSPAKTK